MPERNLVNCLLPLLIIVLLVSTQAGCTKIRSGSFANLIEEQPHLSAWHDEAKILTETSQAVAQDPQSPILFTDQAPPNELVRLQATSDENSDSESQHGFDCQCCKKKTMEPKLPFAQPVEPPNGHPIEPPNGHPIKPPNGHPIEPPNGHPIEPPGHPIGSATGSPAIVEPNTKSIAVQPLKPILFDGETRQIITAVQNNLRGERLTFESPAVNEETPLNPIRLASRERISDETGSSMRAAAPQVKPSQKQSGFGNPLSNVPDIETTFNDAPTDNGSTASASTVNAFVALPAGKPIGPNVAITSEIQIDPNQFPKPNSHLSISSETNPPFADPPVDPPAEIQISAISNNRPDTPRNSPSRPFFGELKIDPQPELQSFMPSMGHPPKPPVQAIALSAKVDENNGSGSTSQFHPTPPPRLTPTQLAEIVAAAPIAQRTTGSAAQLDDQNQFCPSLVDCRSNSTEILILASSNSTPVDVENKNDFNRLATRATECQPKPATECQPKPATGEFAQVSHNEDTPAGLPIFTPAGLQVLNSEICTEITGFGQHQPFPSRIFNPTQKILVYCEVENFLSLQSTNAAGSNFVTRLQGRYQIFDRQGNIVQSGEFPVVEDVAINQRRDFYLYFPIAFQQLATGQYELALSVEDLSSNQTAEVQPTLQFSIP